MNSLIEREIGLDGCKLLDIIVEEVHLNNKVCFCGYWKSYCYIISYKVFWVGPSRWDQWASEYFLAECHTCRTNWQICAQVSRIISANILTAPRASMPFCTPGTFYDKSIETGGIDSNCVAPLGRRTLFTIYTSWMFVHIKPYESMYHCTTNLNNEFLNYFPKYLFVWL